MMRARSSTIHRSSMASAAGDEASRREALLSRAHIVNATLAIAAPMSLKCAVELGVFPAVYHHGRPMSLPDLVSALSLPPEKSPFLARLMRVLAQSGFFAEGEDGYVLTLKSQHLVGKGSWFTKMLFSTAVIMPWLHLSSWFREERLQPLPTPFHVAHGMGPWEYTGANPEFNDMFNNAMAHDSDLIMGEIVDRCGVAFEGVKKVVDVGGGNGELVKALAGAFMDVEFVVFDLPHVVEGLPASERVEMVGGSMFESVPQADALILKRILHDHSDEDCVKILKNCKESIPSKKDGGKVILIEMVLNVVIEGEFSKCYETQLYYDMLMMTATGGKERDEQEWSKIITEAGFSSYKITPISEFFCVIEVYP